MFEITSYNKLFGLYALKKILYVRACACACACVCGIETLKSNKIIESLKH